MANINVSDRVQVVDAGPNEFSQGPLSPGTGEDLLDGFATWANPNNIKVSDNVYAVCAPSSQMINTLIAYNFGFTIPTGAIISGFLAEIEGKNSAGDSGSNFVVLIRNATETKTLSARKNTVLTASEAYVSTGDANSPWVSGPTFSPSEVNSTGFYLAFADGDGTNKTTTVSIDHMRLTTYYTTGIVAINSSENLNDNVTVTESIVLAIDPILYINKFDSIAVSESVNVLIPTCFINQNDSINVSDVIVEQENTDSSLYDLTSTSESISIVIVSFISINESITVSELYILDYRINIISYDSVSITERYSFISDKFGVGTVLDRPQGSIDSSFSGINQMMGGL